MDKIEVTQRPDFRVDIAPVWGNSGQTPTKRALTQINIYVEEIDMPAEFDFPDTNSSDPQPIARAAGQTGAIQGPTISVRDIEALNNGQRYFYVYGWVDYNDVFERTLRHRTEFCSRLIIDTINGQRRFTLLNYHRFSGFDEECYRRPTT